MKNVDDAVWRTLCKAIGAELREHSVIVGASGVEHNVQAIAVDDLGRRIIVLSAEPSSRVAAMMQGDIQATLPNSRVIVARPIAFDINNIAQQFASKISLSSFGTSEVVEWGKSLASLSPEDQQKMMVDTFSAVSAPALNALKGFSLPFVAQSMSLLQQLSHLDWDQVLNRETGSISLQSILSYDNLKKDRDFGVCSLPLYEFDGDDWAMLSKPSNAPDVATRLRELGIFQYFFPSPDATALGLVERGISNSAAILETIKAAETLGHPLSAPEITDLTDLPDVLSALEAEGYIAEGEHGVEISSSGKTQRLTVKFRPREGFLTKLLNRVSVGVSVSPKDFMP